MPLPLTYRAARPFLSSGLTARVLPTALPKRHGSLSAIHRGLLRSGRARDGVDGQPEGAKKMTYAERRKAREELAQQRPTFKIRKGKKDITEYPGKAKSKSRQARFYNPESPFGKKSLVYQLKTGKLPEELKTLRGQQDGEDADATSPFQRTGPRPDLHTGSRRTPRARRDTRSVKDARDVRNDRDDRDDRGDSDPFAALSQPAERPRRAISRREAIPVRSEQAPGRKPSRARVPLEPLSIPYTTAASQFLYGKAVVEAALRSSRRKLYKLYVYNGANRQNAADNALLQKLARRKGVPVTVVGEDGLRLLDKMSSSRPHNGFVLEASPLPQPPLAALGPLPDDYAADPRFAVVLAHQSAEEAAVNGAPASARAPSATHRPLVLVLDRILDPGNLGAILRTAGFLGAAAVAITRRGSASLTPVALKASAGAGEALPLFSVASLPEFLAASRANGWAVYAAVASHGGGGGGGAKQRRHVSVMDVEEADPLKREPCVLLLGSEGEGLDRLVVKKADYEVNIPNMSASTAVDSLNVSVAAGLLCSAFLKGMAREQEKALQVAEGGGEVLW